MLLILLSEILVTRVLVWAEFAKCGRLADVSNEPLAHEVRLRWTAPSGSSAAGPKPCPTKSV
jgi:hypothetical protein